MKKLFFLAVLVLAIGSLSIAQTLPKMANGKHDFRFSKTLGFGIKGASEALCGYCHTPHVPATGIKTPLWARAKTRTTGYGVYSSTTMDATPTSIVDGNNDNNSSMCMSCHDGSALFQSAAYVKRPYGGANSWTGIQDSVVRDPSNLFNGVKYGAGLSHTHPVNFTYADATTDAGINAAPLALDGYPAPRLFDGMMQCGSCHEPHEATDMTNPLSPSSHKFIEITTDNSILCISCHNK